MGSIGAARATGNSTGLGGKRPLTSANDYTNYSEYAGELAGVQFDFGTPVYQIEYNGGKAFADTSTTDYPGELHIGMMASTGQGAGTEMLARLAEQAYKQNLILSWAADQPSAVEYYKKMGVEQFGTVNNSSFATWYEIPHNQLQAFAAHLRSRRR